LDGEIITNVKFYGGCAGNTMGIQKIVKGMNARDVIKKFRGIPCGNRRTSCPDQLAIALQQALDSMEDKQS
jgi:uncharacterized protein (TIGR03905 family)